MICEQSTTNYPAGRTGTPAGYLAHLQVPESACDPCRKANNEKTNRWRQANPEIKRLRDHRYYVRNREKIKRHILQRYKERQAEVWALKRDPCTDCGVSYPPYVMHWDHRDPADKEFNVSTAVAGGVSMETIVAEIAKCDLVCANCHAERTYGS